MAAFIGDDSSPARPFDDGGYASQRFESYSFGADSSPAYGSSEDVFGSQAAQEQNGGEFGGGLGEADGPVLPPPTDMHPEEGFALREWRRLNTIRLEEKEKEEKEMLQQILEEAEEFKIEFYRKCALAVENSKAANREKEKLFVANRQKFHVEAEQNYWKAIAELIPHEVPVIEKRGKKDKEKTPSVVVIQGPKPGKPTDLSRLRQILIKLKHNTPPHMKPKPPEAAPEAKKDAKAAGGAPPTNGTPAPAVTPEASST